MPLGPRAWRPPTALARATTHWLARISRHRRKAAFGYPTGRAGKPAPKRATFKKPCALNY
jgi:hypothetical protein